MAGIPMTLSTRSAHNEERAVASLRVGKRVPIAASCSRWTGSGRAFPGERKRSRLDGRGLDDARCCRTVGQKDVQNTVELVDGRDVGLEDKTIFSRNAMALLDLRNLPCKFGNLRELAGMGTDADIGGDGQPKRRGIHIHPVATNHPRVLKLAQPLSHRGCRHSHAACEFAHRQAGITLSSRRIFTLTPSI